eukprot:TRINITY_DN90389_c0_g1_i1.p1 TRINITY_DN90389_c0_g1~~TRINITY_DN90389_c0_g1_i1.p1  ORF type:complete len:449 (+),score=87.05 TRINITY_DN90389_c0_g1_i1:39-1385(+)
MSEPEAKRRKIFTAAGRRVKVQGLTSDSGKLINGELGTVVEVDASGRVSVDLDNGEQKALKIDNLVLARSMLPGSQVQVRGLQSAGGKALNGKTGTVTSGMDPFSLRHKVLLDGSEKALKKENLKALDEPLWGLELLADAESLQGSKSSRSLAEDRHVSITDLNGAALSLGKSVEHLPRPCAIFAVCGGHRGASCSEYVSKHLHSKILVRLADEGDLGAENVKQVLKEAIAELDNDFLSKHECADGATAVVAVLLGTSLYIANLGDNAAVLCDAQGTAERFEFPEQKPGDPDETHRVAFAGGQVIESGANAGCVAHADFQERTEEYESQAKSRGEASLSKPAALNVSRAFGNKDFKLDGDSRIDIVSSEAEVRHIDLVVGRHTAVALVSRAVLVSMSCDEIGSEVAKLQDPKEASGLICNESLGRGVVDDNVTAVVVIFKWGKAPSVQ